MTAQDPLHQNIRRTTGLHALRKIRAIVDEDSAQEAGRRRALRWLLRYGWIVLLLAVALLARLMGVY
jgi:hypothetical protein